jgi:prefoldin subunit 2
MSKSLFIVEMNRLVMETIKDLDNTRKCWRLVNGVLLEKTKGDIIPELLSNISNMDNVVKQLSDALSSKKQEIMKLEQM